MIDKTIELWKRQLNYSITDFRRSRCKSADIISILNSGNQECGKREKQGLNSNLTVIAPLFFRLFTSGKSVKSSPISLSP